MKSEILENLLSDPQADVGTGLWVTHDNLFCFTIKKKERWQLTEMGKIYLPFGGIGGKLESNELPSVSLHRESLEEVGSDVEIFKNTEESFWFEDGKFEKVHLKTSLEDEPLPQIIYKSPKAEINRKPYTYVLIYRGVFLNKSLSPIDDPAIIKLDLTLLLKVCNQELTVNDFIKFGGLIDSRIKLPADGILKPVGTAVTIAHGYRAGLL